MFGSQILRGCRSVKASASGFEAFDVAEPAAARRGGRARSRSTRRACAPPMRRADRAAAALDAPVDLLRLYPGMPAALLRAAMAEPIRGLVLEAYGAGNLPDARRRAAGGAGRGRAARRRGAGRQPVRRRPRRSRRLRDQRPAGRRGRGRRPRHDHRGRLREARGAALRGPPARGGARAARPTSPASSPPEEGDRAAQRARGRSACSTEARPAPRRRAGVRSAPSGTEVHDPEHRRLRGRGVEVRAQRGALEDDAEHRRPVRAGLDLRRGCRAPIRAAPGSFAHGARALACAGAPKRALHERGDAPAASGPISMASMKVGRVAGDLLSSDCDDRPHVGGSACGCGRPARSISAAARTRCGTPFDEERLLGAEVVGDLARERRPRVRCRPRRPRRVRGRRTARRRVQQLVRRVCCPPTGGAWVAARPGGVLLDGQGGERRARRAWLCARLHDDRVGGLTPKTHARPS